MLPRSRQGPDLLVATWTRGLAVSRSEQAELFQLPSIPLLLPPLLLTVLEQNTSLKALKFFPDYCKGNGF